MTFTNFFMLGGMAAVLVPLIIHLLNRSRYKVVKWGAMHLLGRVVQQNKKRMRREQMILLAIRCAVPIVLALCLARPVLTGFRALTGDVPSSAVLVLDRSYSMQAGTALRTNFQSEIEEGGRILGQMKGGSDASVLLAGGSIDPLAGGRSAELQRLADALQDVKADGGALRAGDVLAAAAREFVSAINPRRSLVILSDFQEADWSAYTAPQQAASVARAIHDLPGAPAITLFRVGTPASENVAVESVDFPRMALGAGQSLSLRATLRNYGLQTHNALRVYCRVDGKQHSAAEVNLAAEGTAQAQFSLRFTEPGSHLIEVEADAADLKADNVYAAAVQVLDRLPVLLIDGDPRPQKLLSATGFLGVALQPQSSDRAQISDMIDAETVSAKDFTANDLSSKRAVVLANVARLQDDQVAAIESFVREGGGLLVFPGSQTDAAWYNQTLAADAAGLLPMRFGDIKGQPVVDPSRKPDSNVGTIIPNQQFAHPALELFSDPKNANLAKASIRAWFALTPQVKAASGEATGLVVAKFANGDPFLAAKSYGDGTVVLAATACDASWSNLPMRVAYVPLMQRLVAAATSNAMPSRNVAPGHPLMAYIDPAYSSAKLQITDPRGRTHEVIANARGQQASIEFADTRQPGVYTLTSAATQTPMRPIQFVVQTDRAESRLQLLSDADLKIVAKNLDAEIVRSGDEYSELERKREVGQELWKPLLWGVLVLLFCEQFIARRFLRGATAPPSVVPSDETSATPRPHHRTRQPEYATAEDGR